MKLILLEFFLLCENFQNRENLLMKHSDIKRKNWFYNLDYFGLNDLIIESVCNLQSSLMKSFCNFRDATNKTDTDGFESSEIMATLTLFDLNMKEIFGKIWKVDTSQGKCLHNQFKHRRW